MRFMQKWEYKRVYKQNEYGDGWPSRNLYPSDNPDFKHDGRNGWEMFAVDDKFYFFKRPL